MAEMSGDNYGYFFDSENGDRKYNAASFEMWLKKFFTSGVFYGDLQVSATGEDMTVSSASGYSNIQGKVRLFSSEESLTIETAHATYDRIDTIVVERNDTERQIIRKVVKGGYSSEPEPTAPVRSDGVYQLVLAEVYVAAGATSITQSVITDKRADTSVCGYVVCPIEDFDFTQFATQCDAFLKEFKQNAEEDWTTWATEEKAELEAWETQTKSDYEEWEEGRTAAFNTWFAGLQNILDKDTAAHLLNLINKTRDGILQGTQNKTTVYNGSTVTDTWTDGHYCITTYNGNVITEKMYDGSDVLEWTKTTTYDGNTVKEVYS